MRITPLKWRRPIGSLVGVQLASLGLALVVNAAPADPPIDQPPEKSIDKPIDKPVDKLVEPAAAAPIDFSATLREMRAALREVSGQRQAVKKRGDAIKEACVYERQRAIAQAVSSTEEAQVSFERASKLGDAGKAQAQLEQARAQKAAEMVRKLVSAAENCVGEELRGGTRPTTITVKGPSQLDDPRAGPDEIVQANPIRLELPSRPNPASVYRP